MLKILVLVFLAVASQQCSGQLTEDTLRHLNHITKSLASPEKGPVLGFLINGLHELVSDPQATAAIETTLKETIKLTENEKLVNMADYLVQSVTLAVENPDVREVLWQRLALTNEVFHKDTLKTLISKAIQLAFRINTDREVLRAFRQIVRAVTKILTDPRAQHRISTLLLRVVEIISDPEALQDLARSIRVLDHIISHDGARDVIWSAASILSNSMGLLSENQARRIGNMQARLAANGGQSSAE